MYAVANIEKHVKESVFFVQDFSSLCVETLRALLRGPRYTREMLVQMDVIGVGSLPIIVLTGLFTGMVMSLQSALLMRLFDATIYVGKAIGISMVKELGPVLAALMLAGRVGSGIAAELGSMVDTEQIDAMEVEGSDPVRRLVVPRLVACVVALPLLTLIVDAIGIFGGALIAHSEFSIDYTLYWSTVFDSLGFDDVMMGLIKPAIFGFIIAMVGCYKGLTTHGGTVGVGLSTTDSVVYSSISILVTDFFITKAIILLT